MNRRRFLLISLAGALAAPLAAQSQPSRKVPRIGFLITGSPADRRSLTEAFGQGLRELGWAEGQNILIEYRFAQDRFERLSGLATELVRLNVDLIVAGPTPAAVAARNATATIPIVMAVVGDPGGLGLITSLAHPGGNVTGLSYSVGVDTFGKGLELLKETIPRVRRVAVLSNPGNPAHALAIRDLQVAARSLGVQLQLLEARALAELDAVFAAIVKEHTGALLVAADSLFNTYRARLAELAARNHLPTMYGIRDNVEAGGLMSYGPNLPDLWRRTAVFVDKILKGAKPADLPVEQPTKFDLVINLKTAKALGLTIPPSLLARADRVIE